MGTQTTNKSSCWSLVTSHMCTVNSDGQLLGQVFSLSSLVIRATNRSRVRLSGPRFRANRSHAHVPLLPCSIIWYTDRQRPVMLCARREGNGRSGVALIMCHGQYWNPRVRDHAWRHGKWIWVLHQSSTEYECGRLFSPQGKHDEWKKRSERRKHRAGCSKAEPKIFAPPQTPFPGAQDGRNLISCRWSLSSPTDQVWWKSMQQFLVIVVTDTARPPARPPVANRQDW